jgi:CubicO group peptidase (beta-lactamase class C family)
MVKTSALLFLSLCALTLESHAADQPGEPAVGETVDKVIRRLMQTHNIPGMAVAVAIDGKTTFCNYGVASRKPANLLPAKPSSRWVRSVKLSRPP